MQMLTSNGGVKTPGVSTLSSYAVNTPRGPYIGTLKPSGTSPVYPAQPPVAGTLAGANTPNGPYIGTLSTLAPASTANGGQVKQPTQKSQAAATSNTPAVPGVGSQQLETQGYAESDADGWYITDTGKAAAPTTDVGVPPDPSAATPQQQVIVALDALNPDTASVADVISAVKDALGG